MTEKYKSVFPSGDANRLQDYDPAFLPDDLSKAEGKDMLKSKVKEISDLQYRLYAENKQALLVVLQGMDASGKDSAIRHIFSGINPQGVEVTSFKKPTAHEMEHDFIWRHYKALPAKGNIGVFNRSHYENVLITRVHPEWVVNENIPGVNSIEDVDGAFWAKRFEQINRFEQIIHENGIRILKFFLNISKEEQKSRFLKRIENPEKNWKFSMADVEERAYWNHYQHTYEQALLHTSTDIAPWHIIPSDHKWMGRLIIAETIRHTLAEMHIQMPELSEEARHQLTEAGKRLREE